MGSISCPYCYQADTIQQIPAILSQKASSTSFSVLWNGRTATHGKLAGASARPVPGETDLADLAELLGPPKEPAAPIKLLLESILFKRFFTYIAVCLIGGMAFVVINILSNAIFAPGAELFMWLISVLGFGLCILAFLILCVLLYTPIHNYYQTQKRKYRAEYTDYEVEKLMWKVAMSRWNRLYYCHRHGIVFDPENGEQCKPGELHAFLYRAVSGG